MTTKMMGFGVSFAFAGGGNDGKDESADGSVQGGLCQPDRLALQGYKDDVGGPGNYRRIDKVLVPDADEDG